MTVLSLAAVLASLGATLLSAVRWLRVAQREHYLPGAATRFALRWWLGFGPNRLLGAVAVVGVVLSPVSPLAALAAALALGVGPFRMRLAGRAPGPLVWTRRMRTLALTVAALTALPVGVAAILGAAVPVSALAALLSPLAVDLGCAVAGPFERRLADRFVAQAQDRLRAVDPIVVGVTGSYGKTSTKVYTAHLCAATLRALPTPASFNNRAGLSRAVNEMLTPGTDVFIAEMGTYGAGEIAELCTWCPPRLGAITSIGPVHLERFGSEDAIVASKQEIFGPAEVAILNVDDPRLSGVADAQEARGLRVWRCSAIDVAADVCASVEAGRLIVTSRGEPVAATAHTGAHPTNVAVAVAIALELGVPAQTIGTQLATLPGVPNRAAVGTLTTGARVVDDTFNSNPAGSRAALTTLLGMAGSGKRVVVTPGMIELGSRQREENTAFARALATAATHVIVVGWTNRAALLTGLRHGSAVVLTVDQREQAVTWVRANTGPEDVVLYENDLPDHYP